MEYTRMPSSRVENLFQALSCKLKFVHVAWVQMVHAQLVLYWPYDAISSASVKGIFNRQSWDCGIGLVGNWLSMGCLKSYNMDKLELTGQNLGRVFNSRWGRTCVCHAIAVSIKQPSLKLKTGSKLLFGSLPINTSFARTAWMLLPCRPIDVISTPSTKDLHGETLCSTNTLNYQSICSTQDNSKPDPVDKGVGQCL